MTDQVTEFEMNHDRSHEIYAYYTYGFTVPEIAEMFELSIETTARLYWEAQNDTELQKVYRI